MFTSKELDNHLKTSDTVQLEQKIFAEWNMNDVENISKLGNYRYRPSASASPYYNITTTYDPNDLSYNYTNATDSDIAIESGLNEQDQPTTFVTKQEKMKLLYSLEDCIKPFRPRSGINKVLYLGNSGNSPASAQYIDDAKADIARRPRYYMSSKDDQFKYWTSYRTEVVDSTQFVRGFSFLDADKSINYIDDACPFVVYENLVPTNKIVVKMQTNVGDLDRGEFTYGTSKIKIPDPLYGDNFKTTPVIWQIQGLDDNNSWVNLISFDSNSTKVDGSALISADGYVQISYGLKVPEKYKSIFIFAEEIPSATLLPDATPEGYAYLVKPNEDSLGTFYIYINQDWETFIPEYGWAASGEDLDRNTPVVTKLVDPESYKDANGNVVYREFQFIKGLRIVVKTMNRANCTFDLIEFSPRLFANITEAVSNYSVSKILSDLGNSSIPVGGMYATTGSLSIFDSDFSFNSNNPFDPLTGKGSIVAGYVDTNSTTNVKTVLDGYLSNMIKFNFYEAIRNVGDYDYYLPVKAMYAYGFPQTTSPASNLELELRDFFFFLESSPAPQLLMTDVSLSYAVTLLLDYIGFDNYVFKRIIGKPEIIIPYFFVEQGKNCAEILQSLAIASQSAMFFDEYNNFVVMSKEYLLPDSESQRATDSTLYGQVQALKADGKESRVLGYAMSTQELPDEGEEGTCFLIGTIAGEEVHEWVTNQWVNQGYAEKVYVPSIVAIASQEKRVYNAGQINYTSRYLQRSIGTIDAALKTDQYKNYIYKPSLLWEVQGGQSRQTINEAAAQNQGYTLSAIPLASDLSASLPYSENNQIYLNTIDVGENVYWMSNYQGYLYANGEIIKYDAIEYSISGTINDGQTGNLRWVSNNQQYQDYFANLPFNGKMYPTGRIRIYTQPEFTTDSNGTVIIKTTKPIKKNGRGQFGTQVTSHSAGLDSYWTSDDNIYGCFQDASQYLFITSEYINYPTVLDNGVAGVQKQIKTKDANGNETVKLYNAKSNVAINTGRSGIIANFLADSNFTETEIAYKKTTDPGTIQSSALVMTGPKIESPIKSSDFTSYILKEFKDSNNAYIPYKHYGTRMRVIGKIESGTNKSQTPTGGYPIYIGNASNVDIGAVDTPGVSSTTPDSDVNILGGSGGIGFNISSASNTGYFYEIVALTASNVSDYQNYSNTNIVSANILASPAPSCVNNEVTVYTKDPIDFEVGQKIIISGLVDTNDPTNTQTPLNGEYAVSAIYDDRKRFRYKINPSTPLNTTSKTGGVAQVDFGGDVNIANLFFYKVLSSSKGNGITSYQRQSNELTLSLKNINQFVVGDYVNVNISPINGQYTIKKIENQSLVMDNTGTNIVLTNRTVSASVTTDIQLVYPTAVPYKLWSGLSQINADTGELYGQARLMAEQNPTVYDLAAEYINNGTTRTFYLYLNGSQVAIVNDNDPLPERNNMALFVRGSSKCMFENIYALGNNYSQSTTFPVQTAISQIFGDAEIDATEAFNKYAISGLVQKTYLSNIASLEDPKYKIYFEEFGTIMREAAYFNIKYDRAYPALSAKLMPTFNNIKGYTTSGFYAWSYGAEFLIFNATDFQINLDDTSGNYLRIMGTAFTQNTTYTLTVDDLYKKRSNLLDNALGKSPTLYNPLNVDQEYNEIKNSRYKYGQNEITIESPYIQSTDVAENIFGWIVDKVRIPRKMVGINSFATCNLQLGDIVNINCVSNDGIDIVASKNKRFVIYQIDYSKGSTSYENTIYLAEV